MGCQAANAAAVVENAVALGDMAARQLRRDFREGRRIDCTSIQVS